MSLPLLYNPTTIFSVEKVIQQMYEDNQTPSFIIEHKHDIYSYISEKSWRQYKCIITDTNLESEKIPKSYTHDLLNISWMSAVMIGIGILFPESAKLLGLMLVCPLFGKIKFTWKKYKDVG